MQPQIILASTSPRRKAILEMLGIDFEVIPADIDESKRSDESPYEYVQRLAIDKAAKVAQTNLQSIVIGGDVTIDIGESLGKAADKDEARNMLKKLSGRTHYIRDGFAIHYQGEVYASGVTSAAVTFRTLSSEEIENYLNSGEWEGKAGAYAIQGEARNFVVSIIGSYYDILGLPIYSVHAALLSMGVVVDVAIDDIYREDISEKVRVVDK